MRLQLLVCLSILLGAQRVEACEIKGDTVGVTTLDEFKKKYRRWIGFERFAPTCTDYPHKDEIPPFVASGRMELGEIKCITTSDIEAKAKPTGTIADVPADFVYSFLDGVLSSVVIRFGAESYPRVSEAFQAKFGEPEIDQLTYNNSQGGQVTGEKSRWKLGICTMEIEQFASSLRNSVARIYVPSAVAELDRRARANPRASNDL